MTVKELIEALQSEDPNALVVMQKDPEGNGHSPMAGYWVGAYTKESTWNGNCGLLELTDEDRKAGYGEDDVIDGEKSVILYPIN